MEALIKIGSAEAGDTLDELKSRGLQFEVISILDDIEKKFSDCQNVVIASGGVPSSSIPNAINVQSWLNPFIENKVIHLLKINGSVRWEQMDIYQE